MDSHKWGFWSKFIVVFLIVLAAAGWAGAKLTRFVQEPIKNVVLDDDGYRVEITTYDSSIQQLLDRYEIILGPGDEILPALDTPLEDNTEIKINRAMTVAVEADGQKHVFHVIGGTVGDMLKKANVTVRKQDIVNYSLTHPVKPLDNIKVTRMDEEVEIETEAIPYQVVTKKSNKIDEGVTRVVEEGQQGERERRTKVVYKDGVEISRELISDEVTMEPVNRVVEKGTIKRVTTYRGDSLRYSKSRKMTATAYTAGYESTGKSPGDRYYGVTSSGRKVKPHHTIAAPPEIPIGTKVYIPELVKFWASRGVTISGIFTVEDRGGAIKGNKIDIYMEEAGVSRKWGRRSVTVYFLRN